MPIQNSGQLPMSRIAQELGLPNSNLSLRNMSASAGKGTPDAMSEFYGYPPCPPAWQYDTAYCEGQTLVYRYHNGSCGYYYDYAYNSTACGYQPQAYYCTSYPGDPCGLYPEPCWVYGYYDCGSGEAIQ